MVVIAGALTWRVRPADTQSAGRSGASHSSGAASTSAPTASSPTLQAPVSPSSAGEAVSDPVHVSVPRIGIDSSLQKLGLLPDGSLQSPTKWGVAGWYARGVRPGDIGPAVIAGHVDSTQGPAAFFKLRQMHTGDQIVVTEQDGRTVHFTVTEVRSYPKKTFPTAAVYGPTSLPELRLITCTGDFDRAAASYLSNLVVFAVINRSGAG